MDKLSMYFEGVDRLRQLDEKFSLNPYILQRFEQESKIHYSYIFPYRNIGGTEAIEFNTGLYNFVKEFEEATDNYVYHVIKGESDVCFLFVTPNENEWKKEHLKENTIQAYIITFNKYTLNKHIYEIESEGARYINVDSFNGALVKVDWKEFYGFTFLTQRKRSSFDSTSFWEGVLIIKLGVIWWIRKVNIDNDL